MNSPSAIGCSHFLCTHTRMKCCNTSGLSSVQPIINLKIYHFQMLLLLCPLRTIAWENMQFIRYSSIIYFVSGKMFSEICSELNKNTQSVYTSIDILIEKQPFLCMNMRFDALHLEQKTDVLPFPLPCWPMHYPNGLQCTI